MKEKEVGTRRVHPMKPRDNCCEVWEVIEPAVCYPCGLKVLIFDLERFELSNSFHSYKRFIL